MTENEEINNMRNVQNGIHQKHIVFEGFSQNGLQIYIQFIFFPQHIWQCPVSFCTESGSTAKKFTRSAGPLGPRPERPWGPRAGPLGPRPERPRGPEAHILLFLLNFFDFL